MHRSAVERSGGTDLPEGLRVRVKVSPGRVKAEHDDAARVARRTRLPLREVTARAEAAWRGANRNEGDAVLDDPLGDEPA